MQNNSDLTAKNQQNDAEIKKIITQTVKKKYDKSGWLILDKPQGMRSTAAVGLIKQKLNVKKAGHAGTLDPLATGMLPIALGNATKTISFIVGALKSYDFFIKWGAETDSCDADGNIVCQSEKIPSEDNIKELLPNFIGNIKQIPPDFSAVKIGGVRAYEIARKGGTPQLNSRDAYVKQLEMLEHHHDVSRFAMQCGKGVYVRAIARDLGRQLGCGGYVTQLRRCSIGVFQQEDMVKIEDIENSIENNVENCNAKIKWEKILKPTQAAIENIETIKLAEDVLRKLIKGKPVQLENQPEIKCIKNDQMKKIDGENGEIFIVECKQQKLKILRTITCH